MPDIETMAAPTGRVLREDNSTVNWADQLVPEALLNRVLVILGTTKRSLWPFWEKTGVLVTGIGAGDLVPSETGGAAEALEDDFAPLALPSGLFSYHFHPTGDHHLAGIDHANYSFATGAFSVGAWIRPNTIVTNVILAKYDSGGNLEEWRLFIDANGKLSLELHDASESATEIAVTASALVPGKMQFVVATYDGVAATPGIHLYVDGDDDNPTGASVEAGAFAAMEDTGAPLTIGCSGVTAVPVAEFHGRIALPFISGKELTAAEVAELYTLGRGLVGA